MAKSAPALFREQAVRLKAAVEAKLVEQVKTGSAVKAADILEKTFVVDLLVATRGYKLPESIASVQELELPQRCWLASRGLEAPPACEFCGKPTRFYPGHGFMSSCPACSADRYRKTVGFPTSAEISDMVDVEKYEIIHFPAAFAKEKLSIRCKRCGKISERLISDGDGKKLHALGLCLVCDRYVSAGERELRDFVARLVPGEEVLANDRKTIAPFELDVCVPSRKTAFEYDGLYWHTEKATPSKRYHLDKTEACEKAGIRLVHVFDLEWSEKRKAIESLVAEALGSGRAEIQARSCQLVEVDEKTSQIFQKENSLGESVSSEVRLGLFHVGKLVQMAAFERGLHGWTLVWHGSAAGFSVAGGMASVLEAFEKRFHPGKLWLEADRRLADRKLYESLGFRLLAATEPDCMWF